LGFFGWPIFRRCRIATPTRTTPIAILTASAARDGAVFCLGGLLPVARTVTATTTANETSHPKMNAAPFRTPPLDGSKIMNALSGSGSSVIAKPIRTSSNVSICTSQADSAEESSALSQFGRARPGTLLRGAVGPRTRTRSVERTIHNARERLGTLIRQEHYSFREG